MSGILYGVGVGPGDPELLTLKAARLMWEADLIVYPAPDTGPSFAREIASPHIPDGAAEMPIIVPMRPERFPAQNVYDTASEEIAAVLDQGKTVVVLCEGDPFFYGSFMYLHDRLADRFKVKVVPGVSSLMACASMYGRPLAGRNDVLTIIPGPLDDEAIEARLKSTDAAAIMKVGRHFPRIRALIERLGLTNRAAYVERATLENQKLCPLADVGEDSAPYFSMILIYDGSRLWTG
ncbi:precorrin-2 C(20)-methyltransferase [Coralliovum pocilloporae]|uniref:precorrin-2 C(20)-methyltransferase n=1 Tax=Coralliovum pocilloporae TaxID=3066369 RepID=UPI0033073334